MEPTLIRSNAPRAAAGAAGRLCAHRVDQSRSGRCQADKPAVEATGTPETDRATCGWSGGIGDREQETEHSV